MIGNESYADYVPDKVAPQLLSRDFLLSVNKFDITFTANCLFRS